MLMIKIYFFVFILIKLAFFYYFSYFISYLIIG